MLAENWNSPESAHSEGSLLLWITPHKAHGEEPVSEPSSLWSMTLH